MKIALIGYGKMGRAIERIALDRGHEIVSIIDLDNLSDFDSENFANAEAAIEFTTPATAAENVKRAVRKGVPVVCGSTGWYSRKPEVEEAVKEAGSALLASSNFSIGVYVFNIINRKLAALMNHLPEYHPRMIETHHVHKLDHPSGTAITLAESIIANHEGITAWEDAGMVNVSEDNKLSEREIFDREATKSGDPAALPVLSLREGEVPGIHTIEWESAVDCISISHSAKSRDGFALGAVMSAEWIAGKKGIFTISDMMDDLLNENVEI